MNMRKLILITLLLLSINIGFSQYNSRPTRSRFYNSKMSTFTIKPGDILLYSVTKDSMQYDMVVTVTDYDSTISFNYSIPSQTTTGTVFIQPGAFINAIAYNTVLNGGTKNFKDTSIFWLSKKNYTDLATAKETTMNLGNGNEIFVRQGVGTLKLNFKGKDKIVTAYNIENQNRKSKKSLIVLNDENNPLILKMDTGYAFTLKEVR